MVINKVKGAYQEGMSLHCITLSFVLSSAFALSGCASTSGDKTATTELNPPAEAQSNPVDPYEGFNRKVFAFNDKVDNYVAEPISNAYKWATPQFMQTGVTNFFNNLKNINVVLNDVMQAKFKQSAEDTGRLLINTTAGVGGFFDVAKYAGLEQNDEDFEQTLAVWGVPQGSYLVIPFIGPSTARGIPGTVFDTAANPATYVGMPVQVVSMLNSRANAEGALKFIDEASLDPYVFTRESFLQWRQNLATDGKSEATNDLADFEKDLLDDATTTDDSQKSGLDSQSAKTADENKELSGTNPNNNAREVHAAISAETSTQSAAVQPAKVASVNTTPGARVDGLQNAAYQDAKKKYELARLEYELLKAEGTKKKLHKTYKAK